MIQNTLLSLNKTKNKTQDVKNKKEQINIDDLFLNVGENPCYLRHLSFEDLEVNELFDVLNSKEKTKKLCDSALNTKISETNEGTLSKEFNVLTKKNSCSFDIEEKEEIINQKIRKYSENLVAKNRFRKSDEQIQTLEIEFKKNPFWDKKKISEMAELTGLTTYQVYKWKWDNSFMI